MGSDGRGARGYYWEVMVGTTVWMMVTDRIARGGTGRLGAVRSLAWAVEASRAWARFLKKDDVFIGLGPGFGGGTGWTVFSVVSALGSGLPANVGIVLDRYEFGFRWIIITCRASNHPCVWLVVSSGEALASVWGTGSVSGPSRRLWREGIVCGSRTGPSAIPLTVTEGVWRQLVMVRWRWSFSPCQFQNCEAERF
jgi:hypothetical protein